MLVFLHAKFILLLFLQLVIWNNLLETSLVWAMDNFFKFHGLINVSLFPQMFNFFFKKFHILNSKSFLLEQYLFVIPLLHSNSCSKKKDWSLIENSSCSSWIEMTNEGLKKGVIYCAFIFDNVTLTKST